MNISNTLTRTCLTFFALAILFFTAGVTWAQTDSVKKKRLPGQATVKGFIGGESHDSYVVRARRNQTLTVEISWQRQGDRKAQFVVSNSADFFSGEVVKGGRETYDGKKWVVKVPATRDYYIYVTAQPAAQYKLKVSVK